MQSTNQKIFSVSTNLARNIGIQYFGELQKALYESVCMTHAMLGVLIINKNLNSLTRSTKVVSYLFHQISCQLDFLEYKNLVIGFVGCNRR